MRLSHFTKIGDDQEILIISDDMGKRKLCTLFMTVFTKTYIRTVITESSRKTHQKNPKSMTST